VIGLGRELEGREAVAGAKGGPEGSAALPWSPPRLVRHESLTVLTQGVGGALGAPFMLQITCSIMTGCGGPGGPGDPVAPFSSPSGSPPQQGPWG
jgi:hypothetical protein